MTNLSVAQTRTLFSAKILVALSVAFAAYLIPTPASACCSVTTGHIKSINYLPAGIFFFSLDAQTNGASACNTQKRFSVNINNSTGKALMALVLASQASGTTMQILGLQTCTTWPDSEDVGSLKSE